MTLDPEALAVRRQWLAEGRPVALATLVEVEGSAPFEPGASMMVDVDGNIEGSVTGGCVEAALVGEAEQVLGGGAPRVRRYGISDELAGDVGLMCGGTVQVLVTRIDGRAAEALAAAVAAVAEGRPAALGTLVDGPQAGAVVSLVDGAVVGTLGSGHLLDHHVANDMAGALERGTTLLRRYGADGTNLAADIRVLVQAFAEPPRMIVVGALDYSVALAGLAQRVGYRVVIVDPREAFLSSPRFASVPETHVAWPDVFLNRQALRPRDVVLVFTHDPKLDEPALVSALRSGAGYVGAMGSRRTHSERVQRLRASGLGDDEIERIAAPCGLDIGARTPAETAISILAEVVAKQNARSGEPLSDTDAPIHPRETMSPSSG